MARRARLLVVALVIAGASGLPARTVHAGGEVIQTLLNTDVWLATVNQPPYEQEEVFVVGDDGAVWTVWKVRSTQYWRPPLRITPPNIAQPGAPLAAVFQPLNNQVEVFFVGRDGTLWDVWKANNGAWQPPGRLSAPNFAPSGGHVAAIFQPLNNQLEVFLLDSSDRLRVIWKSNNGRWTMDPPLPANASARGGSPLSVTYWPRNEELEVFLVGRDGTLRHAYKQHNGAWQSDTISRPIFPAGAPISAVNYPGHETVEVFVVGNDGAMRGAWKSPDHSWTDDLVFGPPGFYSPRAPVATAYQRIDDRLEVFAVAKDGGIWSSWKGKEIPWQAPFRLPGSRYRDGTPLAVVTQDFSEQTDLILANEDAALRSHSELGNGPWSSSPISVTGPFITTIYRPDQCARILRNQGTDKEAIAVCTYIMGLAQFCEAQDAFVVETYDGAGRPNGYACAPYSRPDSILDQIEHIGRGVWQGTLPYLGVITAGAGCIYGVYVSCALLAFEVVRLAGVQVPGVPPEAIQAATQAIGCVSGDMFACAQFALQAAIQGARLAGVTIPGVDVAKVAADAGGCANGDFAACVRLGLTTASAVGAATGASTGDLLTTRDCLAGATQACLALGGRLARLANFPLDRVAQGVANAQRCWDGDTNACLTLGRDAARVAGLPFDDLAQGALNARRCTVDGDLPACQALGRGIAQALHIPLGGVDRAVASAENMRRCANGDQAACTAIGRVLVGSTVANGIENAQKCAGGDRDACIALGRSLSRSGMASDAAKALRCEHGDVNACIDLGRAAGVPSLPGAAPPLPPAPRVPARPANDLEAA